MISETTHPNPKCKCGVAHFGVQNLRLSLGPNNRRGSEVNSQNPRLAAPASTLTLSRSDQPSQARRLSLFVLVMAARLFRTCVIAAAARSLCRLHTAARPAVCWPSLLCVRHHGCAGGRFRAGRPRREAEAEAVRRQSADGGARPPSPHATSPRRQGQGGKSCSTRRQSRTGTREESIYKRDLESHNRCQSYRVKRKRRGETGHFVDISTLGDLKGRTRD